jgi:hypothetical protein
LGTLNANVAGSFPSGRREINRDGVPDHFAAPNAMPANFFNVNSPRGAVFTTPGSGFQVRAHNSNPTNTPVEFGNLNPAYPNLFATSVPTWYVFGRNSTGIFRQAVRAHQALMRLAAANTHPSGFCPASRPGNFFGSGVPAVSRLPTPGQCSSKML